MRPVIKSKRDEEFAPYQTAKRELVNELGGYCSYCERRIPVSLAVEHVQPKSLVPSQETKWDNFLLACANCNSCKNNNDVNVSNLADYMWPDHDDTFHAIQYDAVSAMPSASDSLDGNDQGRVNKLLHLVGLDKLEPEEGTDEYKKASDTRVADRLTAMQHAKELRATYERLPQIGKQELLPILKMLVYHAGFWSIWMHEFECIPEVKTVILECIPGTNKIFFV